jgi:hypothetical protein
MDDKQIGNTNRLKCPIGSYCPEIYEKGKNEACIHKIMTNGDIFWTVNLGKGAYYDTLSQDNAEIIARLVRIEKLLKNRGG